MKLARTPKEFIQDYRRMFPQLSAGKPDPAVLHLALGYEGIPHEFVNGQVLLCGVVRVA